MWHGRGLTLRSEDSALVCPSVTLLMLELEFLRVTLGVLKGFGRCFGVLTSPSLYPATPGQETACEGQLMLRC